jgi:predicted aspartyl protease/tetratricopeptide (TPR) repeat protein
MLISSFVRRSKGFALCVAALAAPMVFASSARADNKCNLNREVEVPISMSGLRPLMTAQINGKNAKFLLDSGAFYSMMSTATAQEFNLKLSGSNYTVSGVGGQQKTWFTSVKDFSFLGATFHDVEFMVSGSEIGGEEAGLIGENLLGHFDVEYDLAKGAVRLYKPQGCERTALAYWAAGQGFSLMDIEAIGRSNAHIVGVAYVNSKKIRALFDTGASTSVLSLAAAKTLDIDVNAPGVVAAGYSYGIGRGVAKSYIVPVASFKVGDNEEIKNTRIRIAGIRLTNADMLVGADFFLSHRVFVSNTQHRLYITYNGGAVFNLASATPTKPGPLEETAKTPECEASSDCGATAPPAARTDQTQPGPQAALIADGDASEYARRGAAFASRRDYENALLNLSKASELDTANAQYFYDRANIHRQMQHESTAIEDLNRAIALDAGYVDAYIARARIYGGAKKSTEALADLDAAEKLAPAQSQIRLALADLYLYLENPGPAIRQWDLWIDSHPVDAHFVGALALRCYAKALQNKSLDSALSDCNRAMALIDMRNPDNAGVLANRGLVRLRQGALDKAISDFNDALKLQPKYARALYGRGVALIRMNKTKQGESDIDAAAKLDRTLKDQMQHYGVVP